MAAGKDPAEKQKPRWPYFGAAQKRLLFCGFVIWIATALPWLIIRPLGISRHASPLAASWLLWAGLMSMAGAMARWRMLALTSAVLAGGTAIVLAGWQTLDVLDRCQLRHAVALRCVPGPGLFILLVASVFVLFQAWRIFQATPDT